MQQEQSQRQVARTAMALACFCVSFVGLKADKGHLQYYKAYLSTTTGPTLDPISRHLRLNASNDSVGSSTAAETQRHTRITEGSESFDSLEAERTDKEATTTTASAVVPKEEKESFAFTEQDMKELESFGRAVAMEHVCWSAGKHWFYRNPPPGFRKDYLTRSPRQPFVEYTTDYSGESGYPIKIDISPAALLDHNNSNNNNSRYGQEDECRMSPIPNHVMITAYHIHMIMEFYMRLVVPWYGLWKSLTGVEWWKPATNGTTVSTTTSSSSPHVQFYIQHGQTSGRSEGKLMTTMGPLMQAFSANPLLLDRHLWDSSGPGCHCVERLILVGYNQKAREVVKGNNQTYLSVRPAPVSSHNPNSKKDVGRYNETRHFLRNQIILPNRDFRQELYSHKHHLVQSALQKHGKWNLDDARREATDHLGEWTVIGFSQRATRRRWLNLQQMLELCHTQWTWPAKIVCTVVNLDEGEARAPVQQVLQHAVLDVWIGIHGSQMVHQVWMPEHATVLELLPHLIQDNSYMGGGWSQATQSHTPNGNMNQNTDMYHFGHPLNIESVPNCSEPLWVGVTNCDDTPWWGERDFVVQPVIIANFVETFIMQPKNSSGSGVNENATLPLPRISGGGARSEVGDTGMTSSTLLRSCQFYEQHSMEAFVLYHVHCLNDHENATVIRKYYRKRDTFPHLAEYIKS